MPSANKDRIRVTLHVDREIYGLLKKWSLIDEKPISRIFDDVFAPLVERFKYSSLEEWEVAEYVARQEEEETMDEALIEEMEREAQLDSMPESEQRKLAMAQLKKLKKKDEEYRARWRKVVAGDKP